MTELKHIMDLAALGVAAALSASPVLAQDNDAAEKIELTDQQEVALGIVVNFGKCVVGEQEKLGPQAETDYYDYREEARELVAQTPELQEKYKKIEAIKATLEISGGFKPISFVKKSELSEGEKQIAALDQEINAYIEEKLGPIPQHPQRQAQAGCKEKAQEEISEKGVTPEFVDETMMYLLKTKGGPDLIEKKVMSP